MTRVPRFVILPETEKCPHTTKLRLNFSDLGAWSDLRLLSLTPDVLSHPEIMSSGTKSASEIKAVAEAISEGQILAAEVPRISGTAAHADFYSNVNVLYALAMLSHRRLPVLATKVVAPWVKSELRAVEVPENWRFE